MLKAPRLLLLVITISISLAAAASTPTPPSLDPLPLPTGWIRVIDGGLTDTRNTCISDMGTYMDRVYLATLRSFESPTQSNDGADIFSSLDGKNWSSIAISELIDQNTIGFELIPVDDRLLALPRTWRGEQGAISVSIENIETLSYAPFTTDGNRFSFAYSWPGNLIIGMNNTNGVQIWQGADEHNLQAVVLNGMGNAGSTSFTNHAAYPVVFNGEIYVGVNNNLEGGQIWRSQDGANWRLSVADGIDSPFNQSLRPELVVSNHIIASASRWSVDGKMTYLLYRSSDGISWEPVTIQIGNTSLISFSNLVFGKLNDEVFLAVNRDGKNAAGNGSLVNSLTEVVLLLKSGNGIDWQPVSLDGISSSDILSASLISYGDYLALTLWDINKLGQIWLTSDGVNWRSIYQAPQYSDTASGLAVFFENGRLYLAECDSTAGFSLLQYQLDIPIPGNDRLELTQGTGPGEENREIPLNRIITAVIILSALGSAWYIIHGREKHKPENNEAIK